MTKKKEHIIWQNTDLDIKDWDFEDKNLTDDEKYERMYEDNNMYLDDERINLDIQLKNPILIIADLGLWNGRKQGYKIIGCNVRDILSDSSCDTIKWYADRYDVRAEAHHHDGTNRYLYREIKNKDRIDELTSKIYNGETINRYLLNKYTTSIRPAVANVYGW